MLPLPLWPIMMYHFQWPEHLRYQADLRQVCQDLEQAGHHSHVALQAKRGLYESAFDFCEHTHPAVQAWATWVKQCVFESAVHSCGTQWPADSSIVVELHESWCHITRDGGYHDVHIHANSSWSAIYYLDCGNMSMPDRNGINRFLRPYHPSYTDAGQIWVTSNSTIDIAAENGQLIVFPSWLQHSALPYHGAQERYVLSVNSRVQLAP